MCITAALACLLGGIWACGSEIEGPIEPADPSPDPPELIEERRSMYELDAARLALREMAKRDTPLAEQPIEIDPELREELFETLLHVFHAHHLPTRDTVVDVYSTEFFPAIHTGPRWPVDEFSLRVDDPPPDWFEAWRNGESQTGEPEGAWRLDYALNYMPRIAPPGDPLVPGVGSPVWTFDV